MGTDTALAAVTKAPRSPPQFMAGAPSRALCMCCARAAVGGKFPGSTAVRTLAGDALNQCREQGIWEGIWRALLGALNAQGWLERGRAHQDAIFAPEK